MNTINTEALLSMGIEGIFYILVIAFSIHALILGFHWLSYGEKRSVAITALATYLTGGAFLLITISSTLFFL